MKRGLCTGGGLILVLSLAANATEFWEKKKFNQWNENEVNKLLSDSPWARQHVESEVHIDALLAPTANEGDADSRTRERQTEPRLTYQVQIRSALPIRQAMVRKAQLAQGYDHMPTEQRQSFDQQAAQFLGAEFPEQVVIYVSFVSNVNLDLRDVARHWQTQTTEKLKNSVYLIGGKGVKAPLEDFALADPGGQAFQLTFPRRVDGHELATAADKELQLEFIHPDIRGRGEKRVLVKFRVNKMLVDGQLEY